MRHRDIAKLTACLCGAVLLGGGCEGTRSPAPAAPVRQEPYAVNPIILADIPDLAVIRVDDREDVDWYHFIGDEI